MKELKISPIKDGTVLDHLSPGSAFDVLKVLDKKLWKTYGYTVDMAVNVQSSKYEKKDIIKVENVKLSEEQLKYISLLAPNATINYIENYEVVEKEKVKIPDVVTGILKCPNERCITNFRMKDGRKEPIDYKFIVTKKDYPIKLKCYYCERKISQEDIPKLLIR